MAVEFFNSNTAKSTNVASSSEMHQNTLEPLDPSFGENGVHNIGIGVSDDSGWINTGGNNWISPDIVFDNYRDPGATSFSGTLDMYWNTYRRPRTKRNGRCRIH